MNALDVQRLSHRYPGRRGAPGRLALSEISLSVRPGELFAILGPNGGGKTTLFKILSTALKPTSGAALIFGDSVVERPAQVRAQLGVVFQHPSLDGKLTLLENVLYQGRLYGLAGAELEKRTQEALENLSLWPRRFDLAERLSGGLQRRVEIAKSLLHRPRLLLMDEPSTGLDPSARREMWDYVTRLRSGGMTIVFTTHLTEEGDRCDRVAIVSAGQVVAEGSPDELKRRIGGDVITVQAADPAALVAGIRSKFQREAQAMDGVVRVEIQEGHKFVPALVEAFPGSVTAVSVGKPTLEDVFVHETGRRYADETPAAEEAR